MSKIINEVLHVNKEEIAVLKKNFNSNDVFIVEIDGINKRSWGDYITEIQSKFRFPTSCIDSIDRYNDWMRDLEWIEEEKIILIIDNYNWFIKDVPKVKSQIISGLKDVILPFWQDEVIEVVVEGKAKSFMVYLVN